MEVSPCKLWLFTGHANGILNIWNIDFCESKIYTLGSEPFRCNPARIQENEICDIVVLAPATSYHTVDIDIYTIGRDYIVKRLKFCVLQDENGKYLQ